MKTLIIALNSKYIHSALAPWYLKACCGPECGEVKVLEHTVNDDPSAVVSAIYREKPGAAAFSCYIWNIRYVYRLVSDLKKIMPHLVIILGGPEVSYDSREILKDNPDIDYIICGEGEAVFPGLIARLNGNGDMSGLQGAGGLCSGNGAVGQVPCPTPGSCNPVYIPDLDSIPSPYTPEMLQAVGNRILYYESSRGCPFSCSYCISSTFSGVRHFGMDRVKRELTMLFESGIRQVKFVDRTFNCNKVRAMEIFRHISNLCEEYEGKNGEMPGINFHFEAAADLFDDEMLELLARVPKGLIQLEIGVQTVNGESLAAVNRKTDTALVFENVRRLRAAGNIHLHLDLIAGLPFEDFTSFRHSFDEVYNLRPHQLQLGFLKLLKGTSIRCQAEAYGYAFTENPPYELLFNKYMGYDELLELKGVEELLDRCFNSGRFGHTLDYVLKYCGSPFDFFLGFHRFRLSGGHERLPAVLKDMYALFREYASTIDGIEDDAVRELLRLDFLSCESSGAIPSELGRPVPQDFRDACFTFLKSEENICRCLPGLKGLPAKEIFKKVRFEPFRLFFSPDGIRFDRDITTVLLFDYTGQDRVTGLFRHLLPKGFSF